MRAKIRIAHVIYRLDYGGLENGLVNLINGLSGAEFEHTVISLTDATEFRKRLPSEVSVVELHKAPGKGLGYLLRLWRILRNGRFDILHSRNLPCLESQVAGFLAGVTARIHGEHGWDVYDLRGSRWRYRLLRKAFRAIVTRYVTVSRHLEDYLTRDLGIPSRRVVRICNGVDTNRFHPASRDSKASRGNDRFVVGSVGRVETVKDYPTLVRAFAMARGRLGGGARLRLVGDGSQRETVQRSMVSEGVAHIAEITGIHCDIPEKLRQFDIFVLPSLAEGISNTILEAMATGLPVIVTAVGGNAELVIDSETGFLVGVGDAQAIAERLVWYRDAPELVARHGRAARDRVVGQFSLDTMVRAYAELYRSSVTAGSV